MPQKKNPDAAELVRAKAGEVIGMMVQLLIILKGLPLTYGKDMQDDKAPTFAATDTVLLSLAAMTGMVRDLTPNRGAHARCLRARVPDRDRSRRLAGEGSWACPSATPIT